MVQEEENVAEQIQQEEVVQPQEENQAPEAPQAQESDKEVNFRKLREAKEQLERENRELREWASRTQRQESKPQEEELGVEDDDIVEGRVVKRLYNELRDLKKFKQSYEQEKVDSIPERLKTKFSDFDQVVSQENIEKLKLAEPELYSALTAGSDLYAKGVSAYKTLKALGYVKEDPYKADKERIAQNQGKPVSAQAIRGQSALSDANVFAQGLTPDLKKQMQKEMQEAIKAR